jgi:hypothetical protein
MMTIYIPVHATAKSIWFKLMINFCVFVRFRTNFFLSGF